MAKKTIVLVLFFLSLAGVCHAGSYTGKITRVQARDSNVILFVMDGDVVSPPGCATNTGWSFAFDASLPSGKTWLSIIELAKATNATVTVSGSGTCDVFTGVEAVLKVFLE